MTLAVEKELMEISLRKIVYIITVSVLYIIYGALQFYNGLVDWWFPWIGSKINLGINVYGIQVPNIFPDPFSGLSLIIVGLVLIRSIQLYHNSKYVKAVSFLFAGWFLGITLMVLNVSVIFADVLGAYYPLIWGESVEGWTLANDPWGAAPHLVIGVLITPMYWFTRAVKDILKGLMPK